MVERICEIALCPDQTIVTHISRLHAHVIQPTRNSARPQPNCRLLHAAASNSDSKRLTNKLFHFVHILSIYSQFSATSQPSLPHSISKHCFGLVRCLQIAKEQSRSPGNLFSVASELQNSTDDLSPHHLAVALYQPNIEQQLLEGRWRKNFVRFFVF